MRIGILTYHRAINYGAFLQCYALATFIKNNFPEHKVEVIDFETRNDVIIKIKSLIKSSGFCDFFQKLKMFYAFHKDVKEYLPLSQKHTISNSPESVSKKYGGNYDIIIVGSDAVWNSVTDESKLNFFLYKITNCKKISYAASCSGLNLNDISNSNVKLYKELLQDFSYLGVREKKGENFLKRVVPNLDSFHNCDPTCFIQLENFPEIDFESKMERYRIEKDKPIVCIMTKNEVAGKMIYEHFHSTHQIVGLYTYNKYADKMLYDLSPMEFGVFFKRVEILFSYFFHGSYLCLKNGVPVIALEENVEPDGEQPKIKYLFERLGLSDWYYRPQEMSDVDYVEMINKAKFLMSNDQSIFLKERLAIEAQNSHTFVQYLKANL